MRNDQQTFQERIKIGLPLLISGILVLGMLIGLRMQPASPAVAVATETDPLPESKDLGQGKIEELIRYVEAKYVDEVNREELVEEAIDNLLKQLDPHSSYISAEHLREINEQLDGNFEGIGIEFLVIDDTVVVVSPIPGGPSEAAGLLAGDKIITVEDSLVAGQGMSTPDIMKMLRGEKGTEVRVGVYREGEPELLEFTIVRDKIPMESVDAAYMLDEETGYIKINRFSATTYEEFMKKLEGLVERQGMKHLVLDLRQNPGGYLQEATNLLSQLFDEKDKLLVYTEGSHVHRSEYKTTGRNYFHIDKIAVLIDEGSASASEIVAGAIQDWDRGVIIGRRSFGKGLVQEQYPLRDGSAIRLTVARYYTPSGRSIQKPYTDRRSYSEDVAHRYENGEVFNPDSIPVVDSTEYYTAGGRIVHGGGGIVPDVFVPLDSILLDDYYLKVRQFVPAFVFDYFAHNGKEFEGMTLDEFAREYQPSAELLDRLWNYALERGVKRDPAAWQHVRPEIARFVRARFAKHLFGDEGYYTVWNADDRVVRTALKTLHEENPLMTSLLQARREK
ncbi:MAG: S41 family peptidase [Bacteroidetes bacterium]|nr:MAG: S41 family peptidase [Bacteroidota bacterium]